MMSYHWSKPRSYLILLLVAQMLSLWVTARVTDWPPAAGGLGHGDDTPGGAVAIESVGPKPIMGRYHYFPLVPEFLRASALAVSDR